MSRILKRVSREMNDATMMRLHKESMLRRRMTFCFFPSLTFSVISSSYCVFSPIILVEQNKLMKQRRSRRRRRRDRSRINTSGQARLREKTSGESS